MSKLVKKLFMILIVSTLMISMVVTTAYAVNTPTEEKKVEHKEKQIKNYKIKWDANGGKIGTKKTVTTTVKKGAKVKIAKTPKRTGYSFQGWHSKKSGGKKITKNTKPTKSTIFYAYWKKTRVLTSQEKKLVGTWFTGSATGSAYTIGTGTFSHTTGIGIQYSFYANGSFDSLLIMNQAYSQLTTFSKGSWRESGGTVYMTNRMFKSSKDGGKTFSSWASYASPNTSEKISHGSDEGGQYIMMDDLKYRKSKI